MKIVVMNDGGDTWPEATRVGFLLRCSKLTDCRLWGGNTVKKAPGKVSEKICAMQLDVSRLMSCVGDPSATSIGK